VSERVTIRISDERKGKWQEYVGDDNHYSTLTHLVKTSVQQEISRLNGDLKIVSESTSQQTTIDTATIEPLRRDLSDLQEEIERIHTRLDNRDRLKPIKDDLLEWLPTAKFDEEENEVKLGRGDQIHSVEDYSKLLDAPEAVIREALNELQDELTNLRTGRYDGEDYYFIER